MKHNEIPAVEPVEDKLVDEVVERLLDRVRDLETTSSPWHAHAA
ncbi:hypothetical protein ACIQ7D_00425 [Streptomyces sp. NPDC096310]